MGLLFWRKDRSEEAGSADLLLQRAQQGDEQAREVLIRKFTPFILKVISSKSGRYVQLGYDDEASIGLMAFNEAIDRFEDSRGVGFLTFAETIIKRRLIDYYRKESKNQKVVPISVFEDPEMEADPTDYLMAEQSLAQHRQRSETDERKDEIMQYNLLLAEYGISFKELVEISPKHEDARRRAMEVAKALHDNPQLSKHLLEKKELPLKQLEELVFISRKTLERQRKYIIAIALILIKDYAYLKEYVIKCL